MTPPPDYTPPAPAVQATGEISGPLYPLVAPSPENGLAIYSEKCAPCHGARGLGDGPRAAQLPNPVTAIGEPEVARQSTPAGWYAVVTLGNLERFMPPFASLSENQRWDVIAYVYSLSAPDETVALGGDLYAENCAGCHGETGQGNRPQASGLGAQPTDFTSQATMAGRSAADLFAAISAGVPPDMPAYADKLSEDERWALAGYLRTLTFHAPGSVASAGATPSLESSPTGPEATPAAGVTQIAATEVVTGSAVTTSTVGLVTGKVTNASGGDLPAGLSVKLHGFDDIQAVITETTNIQPDGSFTFENVEMPDGRAFLVVAEFGGISYGSEVATVEPDAMQLELPVTIYETTTDKSSLAVDRLHLFFEFVDEKTVRVIELYILNNTGDKTIMGRGEGEPVVEFVLPEGASDLEFQDGALGRRYIQTDSGFADTVPIRPGSGEYQVLFAFNMPYDRKLELAQPVHLPVNDVVILVPEGGIKIRSDMLQDDGSRDVQGTPYHLYSASSLPAGENLRLTLTGRPTSARPTLPLGTSNNLIIGLAGFGLALVVTGYILYRRSQASTDEEDEEELVDVEEDTGPQTPDSVMDAILALDDLYQAGQLPEEAYLQRRTELKNRLKALMGN